MSTQLTVQERAAVALRSSKAEAELRSLVDSSKGITAPTNKAARDECHSAAMAAAKARTAIISAGRAARDDPAKFCKAVISEEARLVAIIKPEEDRLKSLRDEFDDEQDRIKAKKAEENRARVERILSRIEQIKKLAIRAAHFSASAERAAELLAVARETEVDATFAEFYGEAVEAKASAIAEISEVVHAKGAAEAAAKKAEADRVETERLRRIADAEAKAKADQEAKEREEARKAEDAKRAEADRIAAEQRKAEDAKRAEADRIAAEQRKAEDAKRDAEQAVIKAEIDAKLKAIADAEAALESKRKEQEAKEQAARDMAQAIKDAEAKAELDRRLAEQRKAAEVERMADKALFDARSKIIDLAESITDTSVLAAMFDAASAVANKAVKLKAA
jgi:hypothetical protein